MLLSLIAVELHYANCGLSYTKHITSLYEFHLFVARASFVGCKSAT